MSEQDYATELEYLAWFYANADFGPAHEDVMCGLQDDFKNATGRRVPKDYDYRNPEEAAKL